jgi:1-phosphofructokinase family hexose kinase
VPKIVCVAGSPSIDKLFEIERLVPGSIHRPDEFLQVPGGKGLNVARAAAALGAEVVAAGLLAGPTGRWIEETLRNGGIIGRFVWTDGQTRSSLSVSDRETGGMTEFYEADTAGTAEAWRQLDEVVRSALTEASWCVLSGTLPLGSPSDGYANLIAAAQALGADTALDVRGSALSEAIAAGPTLVKINRNEAEELLAGSIDGVDGALEAAAEVRRLAGGEGHAAAITLGVAGAVLVDPAGEAWFGRIDLRGRYPVGCGDSFLAAVVVARDRGETWPSALARALGTAAANAERPGAGRFEISRALQLGRLARATVSEAGRKVN